MNILILGGTVFLGRHIVNSALARNHNVTLFNRGIHNPGLFPDIEKIRGDRNENLDGLKGRKFDSVIDTSGYFPGKVRKSAELLKDSTGQYIFISSISVYKDFSKDSLNENSETGKLEDENVQVVNGDTYGPLKVLCENVINEIYGDRSLIIRPGLIVGEYDPSDRFTYWIHRFDKGGRVLLPDAKESNIQIIDVKDLADWTIKTAEEKNSGIYNATGPDYDLNWNKFVAECIEVSGKNPDLTWATEEFLLKENVTPWADLPLWVSHNEEGVNNVDSRRAIKDGLSSGRWQRLWKIHLILTRQEVTIH